MLKPERMNAQRRASMKTSLAIQAMLAAIIIVAALFSRNNPNPLVFWLTLSLLMLPIGVSATYLIALRKDAKRQAR